MSLLLLLLRFLLLLLRACVDIQGLLASVRRTPSPKRGRLQVTGTLEHGRIHVCATHVATLSARKHVLPTAPQSTYCATVQWSLTFLKKSGIPLIICFWIPRKKNTPLHSVSTLCGLLDDKCGVSQAFPIVGNRYRASAALFGKSEELRGPWFQATAMVQWTRNPETGTLAGPQLGACSHSLYFLIWKVQHHWPRTASVRPMVSPLLDLSPAGHMGRYLSICGLLLFPVLPAFLLTWTV